MEHPFGVLSERIPHLPKALFLSESDGPIEAFGVSIALLERSTGSQGN